MTVEFETSRIVGANIPTNLRGDRYPAVTRHQMVARGEGATPDWIAPVSIFPVFQLHRELFSLCADLAPTLTIRFSGTSGQQVQSSDGLNPYQSIL